MSNSDFFGADEGSQVYKPEYDEKVEDTCEPDTGERQTLCKIIISKDDEEYEDEPEDEPEDDEDDDDEDENIIDDYDDGFDGVINFIFKIFPALLILPIIAFVGYIMFNTLNEVQEFSNVTNPVVGNVTSSLTQFVDIFSIVPMFFALIILGMVTFMIMRMFGIFGRNGMGMVAFMLINIALVMLLLF